MKREKRGTKNGLHFTLAIKQRKNKQSKSGKRSRGYSQHDEVRGEE